MTISFISSRHIYFVGTDRVVEYTHCNLFFFFFLKDFRNIEFYFLFRTSTRRQLYKKGLICLLKDG